MGKPAILFDNRLADGALVASSTAAGDFDVANLTDLRAYTWYRPAALPAYLTVVFDTAKAADAAVILAHDLASQGCDVQIRGSSDDFVANDVPIAAVTPASDGPVWQIFASVSYRAWRIRIDGPGSPALDLDFAGLNALPAGVTFTRADATTCATYFDGAGTLKLAAPNVARFDHDAATGESLGLMREEARTNRLIYSTPVPAAQHANPGWSRAVGTETLTFAQSDANPMALATEYVATLATTTAGAGVAITAGYTPAWGANQSYTGSVFWEPFGADKSVRLDLVLGTTGQRRYAIRVDVSSGVPIVTDQSGGTLTDYVVIVKRLRNGRWRIELTGQTGGSPPTAGAAWLYVLRGASSLSCKLWGAMVEEGTCATSYIPTAGAVVTRAKDDPTMTGAAFSDWYDATTGTFLAVGRTTYTPSVSQYPSLFSVSGGTSANQILAFASATDQAVWHGRVAGVDQATILRDYGGSLPAPLRVAGVYAANDYQAAFNGTLGTADTSATVPTVSQLILGADGGGVNALNGTIARLTYWPRRLTNAQLQWLTAADRGSISEPSLAVAMIGTRMELPTWLPDGFDPLGRRVAGQRNTSEGGHPLGRVITGETWKQRINLGRVPKAWVRSTWAPAWKQHLRSSPFVLAWDPDGAADEVRLLTAGDDFDTPHHSGDTCDLVFDAEGPA